jgi:hypothetical protein
MSYQAHIVLFLYHIIKNKLRNKARFFNLALLLI